MNTPTAIDSKLASLPDYAALKKLATALWRQDNSYHGAAVLVGAGFSRCGASTGDVSRSLPLWSDLSKILAQDLGTSASIDPLRLAEEYAAYFGSEALLDLVRRTINDPSWTPGELHSSLLELPWSDVLTTNWDTLLERAAQRIHQPVYNVVYRQEGLSSAREPRIVKLHGTLGVNEELVFTQEDYRAYPQRHAAFVNFARQVFIENELCLLGFSGDDPNFLQWAGWVRDNLATHARRIYLVGALGLTSAKRKYLESINVAPIDLSDAVSEFGDPDTRHRQATQLFLNELLALKPKQAWKWHPTHLQAATVNSEGFDRTFRDAEYAATQLKEQLPALAADRVSYPGWLVCPPAQRMALTSQLTAPFPTAKSMSALDAVSRGKLLYEIAWRHKVTYEAVPAWLVQEMLAACDPEPPTALSANQQLEIAALLLRNTRYSDDPGLVAVADTAIAILQRGAKIWSDAPNEIAFHKALLARDSFDYPALEKAIGSMSATTSIWKLKKASLLGEIGDFAAGQALVAEAHRELLDQYRNDRNSVFVISRLVWATWLLDVVDSGRADRALEELPAGLQDLRRSPWDQLQHLQNETENELRWEQDGQGIVPLFEPGHYRDNTTAMRSRSALPALLLLEGLCDAAGIPLRWDMRDVFSATAARIAQLESTGYADRFAYAIRSATIETAPVLQKVFSRVAIARLPEQEVDYLMQRCTQAIEYWITRASGNGSAYIHAITRLRVFIEVLARVSIRATPQQAKEIFRFACGLGTRAQLRHFWLFDALSHLLQYPLTAIPDSEKGELLLDALSFPLREEISIAGPERWPNPVIDCPGRRLRISVLDRRIGEIIDLVILVSDRAAPALLRLLPLVREQFLTNEECQLLANKLWGQVSEREHLPRTGLIDAILLELPTPDPAATRAKVRSHLFGSTGNELLDARHLAAVSYAAFRLKELPDGKQALPYFDRLVNWRPARAESSGFFSPGADRVGSEIGEALASSVVPAMPRETLTQDRLEKLLAFRLEADAPPALVALPHFAIQHPVFAESIERLIWENLLGASHSTVAHAAFAIVRWRELEDSDATRRLIARLVRRIGSIHVSGLSALLNAIRQALQRNFLSQDEADAVAEVLPSIFDSAEYRGLSKFSAESVSASLVRAACTQLAAELLKKRSTDEALARMLVMASADPLPEVRFAQASADQ